MFSVGWTKPVAGLRLTSKVSQTMVNAFVRSLLAALSGGLVVLCHPDPGWGWLAWLALVPLVYAVYGATGAVSVLIGAVFGLISSVGTLRWIFVIDAFNLLHAMILSAYLSVFFVAWCIIAARLSRSHWMIFALGAPSAWILLDYLRGHAGFLSAPWATLAHTQAEYPVVLQVADVTGEYGVSWLIVLVNLGVAGWLLRTPNHRKVTWFTAGIMLAVLTYGIAELRYPAGQKTLHVAIVQPAFTTAELHRVRDPRGRYARLLQLTREAATTRPDLVVWPESALPNVGSNSKIRNRLLRLARDLDTRLLVGSSAIEKFRSPNGQDETRSRFRNQAFLIDLSQPAAPPYDKQLLVPFGEYVPLARLVTWPQFILSEPFHTIAGDGFRIFELDRGILISPFICWESVFSDLFRPAIRAGARLIVQLTNDNWFGLTGQPRQHNAASVLRSVEYRVPTVIASNTGPSAIYDDRGRRLSGPTPLFEEAWLSHTVTLGRGISFYARHGDIFLAVSALGFIVLLVASRFTTSNTSD